MPWRAWGERFTANMPAEIEALREEHLRRHLESDDFDEDLAAILNPDWFKRLRGRNQRPAVAASGPMEVKIDGEDAAVATERRETKPTEKRESVSRTRDLSPTPRQGPRPKPARERPFPTLPTVEWLSHDEWLRLDLSGWISASEHVITIDEDGLPFTRSLDRATIENPDVPRDVAQAIMKRTYRRALIASFVDILGWDRYGLDLNYCTPSMTEFNSMLMATCSGFMDTERRIDEEILAWRKALRRSTDAI